MANSDTKTVLPQPLTLNVGGESFTLSPLTPNDFARAEQFVTASRLNQYLELTRRHPLADDVRSKTMSEILCAPVELGVILRSPDAQMYCVWLSIKDIGKPTFEKFKQTLDVGDFRDLLDSVMTITGLIGGDDAGDSDPLD